MYFFNITHSFLAPENTNLLPSVVWIAMVKVVSLENIDANMPTIKMIVASVGNRLTAMPVRMKVAIKRRMHRPADQVVSLLMSLIF